MSMATTSELSIELLNKSHKRAEFSCGVDLLDAYLHARASQDMSRHLSVTYVLNNNKEDRIMGYYTLSATTIELDCLLDGVASKLPSYPLFPATLLSRLAVNVHDHNCGFGEILLIDAFKNMLAATLKVASCAAVVNAIDDNAVRFYENYGFEPLISTKKQLYLPMNVIEEV